MRQKTRKTTLLLLIAILITCMLPAAVTAESNTLEPKLEPEATRALIITYINADLSFTGTRADCDATVVAVSGTDYITATVTLKRKNVDNSYTTIKTWSGLYASGNTLNFSNYRYVTSGYDYRLRITATAYKDGDSDWDSDYDEVHLN